MTNQNWQGQVLGGQAPSESTKLRAKQGHAKSATFAKDFFDQKNNPSRSLRPLREPSPTPHAKSAKRGCFSALAFLKFRIPRVSASRNRGAHFAFPNKIPPSRPWRPLREQSAFSLTEVVIAMGVAAVAFTSIIALFPLGLSMSKESYETTQAAFITQSIMSQITDAQAGNTLTGFRRIIKTANNEPTNSSLETINVGTYLPSTNVYIAYTNYVNTNGEVFWKPASTITAADWNSGKSNSTALVRVTLNRIFIGGKTYDIHGVEVQVDYPGNLALTNLARKHEIFSRICH
jgi:type II secretory pathway pseudopilin PulG